MINVSKYLPKNILINEDLEYLGWSAKKIYKKTGIKQRHIARGNETALDLATKACENLFREHHIATNTIDYILYCTQSPDYGLPNNVSILHKRLNLRNDIASLEFNQGCSGYIYGLSLAKSLILTGIAKNVLFVTTDTYSKYIHDDDRANKTIFGDGATATFLTHNIVSKFGKFIFGTNGDGANNLCVNNSGLSNVKLTSEGYDKSLFMNGSEIFNSTLENVPKSIENVLKENNMSIDDVDHFLFHQANEFMLDHLRDKIGIPPEKFHKCIENTGNTVSSSIPILINNLNDKRILKSGEKILLIGFGIGYSWGATIIEY